MKKFKNNYHCYVHHRCHRNNKSIEQNISESKPYNIKIFSIQTLSFPLICVEENEMVERGFNGFKSS